LRAKTRRRQIPVASQAASVRGQASVPLRWPLLVGSTFFQPEFADAGHPRKEECMSQRILPAGPHLDHLKNEAKALKKAFLAGAAEAIERVRAAIGERAELRLIDAQRVIAREYGFETWTRLRKHVQASHVHDREIEEAASLAFAIIRFAQGAAHPPRGARPPGTPKLGEDAFIFLPSERRVSSEDVPAFLSRLASPALISATTTKGIVSMHLLDELHGDRAKGARHIFTNQRAGLDDMIRQASLSDDSRVLVDTDSERRTVSVATVKLWTDRFAIDVGWSVSPLTGEPSAAAQLNLYRSDGMNAP
jgi:hypothetical protein